MELENGDEIIEDPTGNDIKVMVSSLGGTENYYAILKKIEMTYIQTSNWKNLGYFMEYQEGTLQRHFRTVSYVTPDQVCQAFIWYLQNDKRWQSAFLWAKVDLGGEQKTNSQEQKHTQNIPTEAELTMAKALEIFGLKQDATKEQLKRQYRAMIVKCHPDRVHHLDSEFQILAEEKTKLLNRAYKILDEMMTMR